MSNIQLLHLNRDGQLGDDLLVVNAARVSFNKHSSHLNEKDIKLINYLAKHNHVTPFFPPVITVRFDNFRYYLPFIVEDKNLLAGLDITLLDMDDALVSGSFYAMMMLALKTNKQELTNLLWKRFPHSSEAFGIESKPLMQSNELFYSEDHGNRPKHMYITTRIKMPIFLAREWFRHTIGFSRNEVSRRYISSKPEFFKPLAWRKYSPDKKQGSSSEVLEPSYYITHIHEDRGDYRDYTEVLCDLYETAIHYRGVAPEQARLVLPQSTFTEFYETSNLTSYARLYKLRSQPDAQKEIQDYAEELNQVIANSEYGDVWKELIK